MGWKNLTFVLIPHSQSHVKQFKVSRTVLFGIGIFLVVATAVMIFYIVGFQRKSFLLSSKREIERQNEILATVVTELDSSLAALTEKVDSLETVAEQTRLDADISNLDLQLGSASNPYLSGGSGIPLRQILDDINRLERRSYAFTYNFNTMYDQCLANEDFLAHLPSIRPASGFISKEFSWLDSGDNGLSLSNESNPGINITNSEGTPVYATADGVIAREETTDELGRYIEIDHQNGYRTRYSHLQTVPQMQGEKIRLKVGDEVKRGQQIATMGRTGISIQVIAPHLMYTVEYNGTFVDPTDYFLIGGDLGRLPADTQLE